MPQPGMRRESSEPVDATAIAGEHLITPDAVMNAFAEICLAIPATAAVIGVRDLEGLRCVVSFGSAPAVGSRLESEPEFTKRCIETGEVVLCEDTQNDTQIPPAIARSSNSRSAVAIPIVAKGSIEGVIELFSAEPASIDSSAVAKLLQVAKSFAANLVFESALGGQPLVGGLPERPVVPTPTLENQDAASSLETSTPSLSTLSFDTPLIDAPLPDPPSAETSIEQVSPLVPIVADAEPDFSTLIRSAILAQRHSRKFPRKMWLAVAAVAFVAAILFLLALSKHLGAGTRGANVSAANEPKTGDIGVARNESRFREKAATPASSGPKFSPHDSAVVPPATPHPDTGSNNSSNTIFDNPDVASTAAPKGKSSIAVARDLSSPHPLKGRPGATAAATALAPEKPDLGQPKFSEDAYVLSELSGLAPSIQPVRSPSPDFVLDHSIKGHSDWVTSVAFGTDGKLTSGSWDHTIKFWDVKTGQRLEGLPGKVSQVQTLAYSRDGRWLAVENSDNSVSVWNVATGTAARTLTTDKPHGARVGTWVYSIAFSPDGRWLASGVDDRTVRIWDLTTGERARDLAGSQRSVIYIAFSPDGRLLASGSDDKAIEIWDVATGASVRTLRGHTKRVFAVAFSPDGRWLASASGDKTVKLWDVASGREVRSLTGHQGAVTNLAFSPDGHWLASGSWDKTIRIWDVNTGSQLQALPPQAHAVYSVAFDPRGRWLASGSEDGTVKIWRLSDPSNRVGEHASP